MRRLKRWGTLAGSPLLKQALMRVLKVSVLGTTPAMPMSLKVESASCRTTGFLLMQLASRSGWSSMSGSLGWQVVKVSTQIDRPTQECCKT